MSGSPSARSLEPSVALATSVSCDALLAGEGLARVRAAASEIPAAASEFFGFECRLGDDVASSDFLFCAKASEGGREVLAGLDADADLPPRLLAEPGWRALRTFSRAWADPASRLHAAVDNVWVEADLAEGRGLELPSLFLGSTQVRPDARGDARSTRAATSWLVDDALPLLGGGPLPAPVAAAALRAIEALPSNAWVFQAGRMLGRPGSPVRLCVRGLDAPMAVQWLVAIEWPGSRATVESAVATAFRLSDGVDVDVDVGEDGRIGPKLGLECGFSPTTGTAPRLPALLDAWTRAGVVRPAKAAALVAFARAFPRRLNEAAWPADLDRRARGHPPDRVPVLVRWVHHVKLVHREGGAPEAKAYLGVRPFYFEPSVLRRLVDEIDRRRPPLPP